MDRLGPEDIVRGVETQLAAGLHIARSRVRSHHSQLNPERCTLNPKP